MSAAPVLDRPRPSADHRGLSGGMPARRAVIRWALRLLRREWRQQLLILGLITVAVGATVVGATVATNTPTPTAALFGSANNGVTVTGSDQAIDAEIAQLRGAVGRIDVIENRSVQIPGTRSAFELRAQDPRGPFGGPMLSLIGGHYPATADQVAVTGDLAADLHLAIGRTWTEAGRTWTVTGIVEDPQNLLDQFALVRPGQVAAPDNVTVLFNAAGRSVDRLKPVAGASVTPVQTASANVINPQTISIAAAVLGMLLIALVGIGGFTVLAQRRLRAIGMLAAQGATQRHISLVIRANGAATGIVGAVAGFVIGFVAWVVYRPHAQSSAHHVMGVFQLPWTVVGVSMGLAVIAAYAAASRPAKAIARTPVVAALAGRPPAPRKSRRLAVPVGIVCLVAAFLLLGVAGAIGPNGGGDDSKQLLELVVGIVVLAAALILLAPTCLSLQAKAGGRSPVSVRLALRDLARYRARSGSALAAISLSVLIAVVICVVAAARLENPLDYAGPNLASNQLVVYAPLPDGSPVKGGGPAGGPAGDPTGGPADGRPGAQNAAPPVSAAQAQQVANQIAASVGTSGMVTLETSDACVRRTVATGRQWSGAIYVATPQLLNAFGIAPSQVNPDTDLLTTRPGLSSMNRLQLGVAALCSGDDPVAASGCPSGTCIANPAIQQDASLPSGTAAPNTVITQHAIDALGLQGTVTTAGWLITAPNGLSAAQLDRARQLAAAATGMSIETRNSIPSLAQVVNAATVFGILLALGILGMSVGLVRSEAARDLRTLAATGAAPATRRTITAATAGALALTGAVIGIAGGYLAVVGFLRGNRLDGISSLASVPVTNLLLILLGMPLLATAIGWLVAGREPAGASRGALE